MLITKHGKECMASGIRRLLTISVVFIVMVCLLVLVAMNVWYGIVTALLLWVIAIFPDWEYLLGLDEDNAGRETSMDY